MKHLLFGLGLLAATSAQAQVFRHHDRGSRNGHDRSGGTVVSVGVDYGRGGFGYSQWRGGYWPRAYPRGYYAPVVAYYPSLPTYSYYDGYSTAYPYYGSYGTTSSSGAANGLLLGALAGGIIGHNSGSLHHNGWRGAAWGAGVGWLLGTIADANRRPVTYANQPVVVQNTAALPAASASAATTSAAPAQPVTIINNYYGSSATPMSSANALFGR